MTLNVETVMAASIVLSVFAAVAALGTSLVLGIGFERLRAGFETISKQTGFFSDMLNKLDKKVEKADVQAEQAAKSVRQLELKLDGVTEQSNIFAGSIQQLAEKVDRMHAQPAAEQEPVNPHANILRYFKSDSRNALLAANQEKELKRKSLVNARMHAIASEIDVPSLRQERVNDLSRWATADEPSQIHYH